MIWHLTDCIRFRIALMEEERNEIAETLSRVTFAKSLLWSGIERNAILDLLVAMLTPDKGMPPTESTYCEAESNLTFAEAQVAHEPWADQSAAEFAEAADEERAERERKTRRAEWRPFNPDPRPKPSPQPEPDEEEDEDE